MLPPEKLAELGEVMASAIAAAVRTDPNDNVCVHRAVWDAQQQRLATLERALRVIADVHTRDDGITGFVILVGAYPHDYRAPWSPADYTEAWRVVRAHLGMQVEPEK